MSFRFNQMLALNQEKNTTLTEISIQATPINRETLTRKQHRMKVTESFTTHHTQYTPPPMGDYGMVIKTAIIG